MRKLGALEPVESSSQTEPEIGPADRRSSVFSQMHPVNIHPYHAHTDIHITHMYTHNAMHTVS